MCPKQCSPAPHLPVLFQQVTAAHFRLCRITNIDDVEELLCNRGDSLPLLQRSPAPAPPTARPAPPQQPRLQPQQPPAQGMLRSTSARMSTGSASYGTAVTSLRLPLNGMAGTVSGVHAAPRTSQARTLPRPAGRAAVPTAAPAMAHTCSWPGCGQQFSNVTALKQHMEGKHGRFMCPQCKRFFGAAGALTDHVRAARH